jgi:hypothetical protein
MVFLKNKTRISPRESEAAATGSAPGLNFKKTAANNFFNA